MRSMKIKSLIKEKFGDKYEVKLRNFMKPRMKVFRVDGVAENEIVDELKGSNGWLAESDML